MFYGRFRPSRRIAKRDIVALGPSRRMVKRNIVAIIFNITAKKSSVDDYIRLVDLGKKDMTHSGRRNCNIIDWVGLVHLASIMI